MKNSILFYHFVSSIIFTKIYLSLKFDKCYISKRYQAGKMFSDFGLFQTHLILMAPNGSYLKKLILDGEVGRPSKTSMN